VCLIKGLECASVLSCHVCGSATAGSPRVVFGEGEGGGKASLPQATHSHSVHQVTLSQPLRLPAPQAARHSVHAHRGEQRDH